MEFIIFDTEYTSWKGCMENGRESWQKEEIVQIGAIKVNLETLHVIDELNIFVKPKINPILSDYFINLTKITNEYLDKNGIDFIDAYSQFYNFANKHRCFSHAWNKDFNHLADGNIINKNLLFNNIEEEHQLDYKNIAAWLKSMYIKNNLNITYQTSGDIARLLNANHNLNNLNISKHNALYDVYSILEGIKYFKAKDLFNIDI